MADLKTYSVLIAWCDGDDEQGSFGEIVHAADSDDAERKARAAMRAAHIANNGTASCPNCGCTDNDGSDTCPDCGEDFEDDDDEICAEYEHRDPLTGETIFGGSVLECYEGAIWKAADLEKALRDMRAAYGRLHDFLSDAIEGGRLKESDLPDDYQAIVAQLEACAAADHKAKAVIAEIDAL